MSNSSFRKNSSSSSEPGLSEWGLRGHSTPVSRHDGFDYDWDANDWDDDFDDDWDDDF